MKVYLNEDLRNEEPGTCLSSLLGSLNQDLSAGVAVAVNERVVSRISWNSHELREDDRVLLIRAARGG